MIKFASEYVTPVVLEFGVADQRVAFVRGGLKVQHPNRLHLSHSSSASLLAQVHQAILSEDIYCKNPPGKMSDVFNLNHSEQFYHLNHLGPGRVRRVRHKFNSQVCKHVPRQLDPDRLRNRLSRPSFRTPRLALICTASMLCLDRNTLT